MTEDNEEQVIETDKVMNRWETRILIAFLEAKLRIRLRRYSHEIETDYKKYDFVLGKL